MNVLSIAQQVARRAKDPIVTNLFNDSDKQALAYLGYIEQSSNEIYSSNNWRSVMSDYSFTTIQDQQEYDLPDDFESMGVYYLFDKTRNEYIENESDDSALSSEIQGTISQSNIKYRLLRNKIKFTYPIDGDRELLFTYKNKNFVTTDGNVPEETSYFVSNDSEFLINDEVLILGALVQRSLTLGYPDLPIKISNYQLKLQQLIDADGGKRKTNIFNSGTSNKISPTEYQRY